MPKTVVMDEFHLTVYAPAGLLEESYDAMGRTLDDRRFQADLRRAVRGVCRPVAPLERVRVRLTR